MENNLENNDFILYASSKSDTVKFATALSHKFMYEYNSIGNEALVEIRAVGAGAVNQAVKSIALARGFVSKSDINLICIPVFGEFTMRDGSTRSGMRLILRAER